MRVRDDFDSVAILDDVKEAVDGDLLQVWDVDISDEDSDEDIFEGDKSCGKTELFVCVTG